MWIDLLKSMNFHWNLHVNWVSVHNALRQFFLYCNRNLVVMLIIILCVLVRCFKRQSHTRWYETLCNIYNYGFNIYENCLKYVFMIFYKKDKGHNWCMVRTRDPQIASILMHIEHARKWSPRKLSWLNQVVT